MAAWLVAALLFLPYAESTALKVSSQADVAIASELDSPSLSDWKNGEVKYKIKSTALQQKCLTALQNQYSEWAGYLVWRECSPNKRKQQCFQFQHCGEVEDCKDLKGHNANGGYIKVRVPGAEPVFCFNQDVDWASADKKWKPSLKYCEACHPNNCGQFKVRSAGGQQKIYIGHDVNLDEEGTKRELMGVDRDEPDDNEWFSCAEGCDGIDQDEITFELAHEDQC